MEELLRHKEDCISGLRGAKNWEEHILWEARISLIEELIDLPKTMISEEERVKVER